MIGNLNEKKNDFSYYVEIEKLLTVETRNFYTIILYTLYIIQFLKYLD